MRAGYTGRFTRCDGVAPAGRSQPVPRRGMVPSMFLAQTVPPPQIAIVSTLDGVTTVLVGFLFVCLVLPSMVRNRPQFYAAMACLLAVIAVHTLALVFGTSPSFALGMGVATGGLQLAAFLLLVLCVGGLTVKQLAGDMAKAYEVIRRGETKRETIIPIGDQAGRRRPGESPPVYRIDAPTAPLPVDDEDEDDGTGIK